MEKRRVLEYNTENQPEQRLNSIAYKTANNIELNNFEKKCTRIIKSSKLNRTKT
jgi:hypothetical protein